MSSFTTPFAPPKGLPEIISTFGDISIFIKSDGTLSQPEMNNLLTTMELPYPMIYAYDSTITIKHITCHKKIAPIFMEVFNQIKEKGFEKYAQEYGGCYVFRPKRLSQKLSCHSWGIAIDINPRTNKQGTPGNMNKNIVTIFESLGFTWGGRWKGTLQDSMHFQYATHY